MTKTKSTLVYTQLVFQLPFQVCVNRYERPKNEPKFLKASLIFLNFSQFDNYPFFLPSYFVTPFSCLASKSS